MAGEKRETLTIRMEPALRDRVVAVANERVISTSLLVQFALEDFLQRLIPLDELRQRHLQPLLDPQPTPGNPVITVDLDWFTEAMKRQAD